MIRGMQDQDMQRRIDRVLDEAVASRRVVGAVFRVARHGETVYTRAVGLADREAGAPMREDTLFRYASLTKPVTAITALGLIAEGKLRLEDPVTRWFPDFRPTFQGKAPAITVRHLLTHTSGLGYAFFEPKDDGAYRRARVSDGLDQPGLSFDENLRRLGTLPLYFEPGTAWRYSLAHDILGEIVARVAGAPLPRVVAQAVTEPLGMKETGFRVFDPSRLAVPYGDGKPEPVRIEDGTFVPFGDGGVFFAPSRIFDSRSYPSGGAGMAGSSSDFLRFLEALRTRHPFAPRASIDAMVTDQIAPITSPILMAGWGYGYGASVLRDPSMADSPLHAGTIRWGGAYGHSWWIDPTAELSAVLLTNTTFEGMVGQIRTDLQRAAQ
jgi:CubicO group peptidase (beta-lactamase class C family)